MSKVMLCDVCRHEGKMVETTKYLRVKGNRNLRLDLCDRHMWEVKRKYPMVKPEYRKFVIEMTTVIKMSEVESE